LLVVTNEHSGNSWQGVGRSSEKVTPKANALEETIKLQGLMGHVRVLPSVADA